MKRTNSLLRFLTEHRRVLCLLLLPIGGCVCGLLLFSPLTQTLPSEWTALIPLQSADGTFPGLFSVWWSACFTPLCLLLLLFLSGLSAGGMPMAVVVPFFWGIGIGMSEAYYAAQGWSGLLVIAAVLLPPTVIKTVALLMACSESLRLSVLITVQLLPRSARCGGLWQDFRLFCVRFLLFVTFVLGAGIVDVLLRFLLREIL